MRELCVLNVAVSRRLLSAALAVFLLALSAATSGSETIQVTLYYPAPIGAYINMQFKDYVRVGSAAGQALYIGSLAQASSGGYGLYVRSGNMVLNIRSTVFPCPVIGAATNMPASIWLMAKTGAIRLPGAAAFSGVCAWSAGVNSPTAFGSPDHNTILYMLAAGSAATKVVSSGGPDGLWCRVRAKAPGL